MKCLIPFFVLWGFIGVAYCIIAQPKIKTVWKKYVFILLCGPGAWALWLLGKLLKLNRKVIQWFEK